MNEKYQYISSFINQIKDCFNNKESFHFFHLSHIDLDGYGCQFIVKNIFKDFKKENNISFYNSNCGNELKEILNTSFKDINLYLEKNKENKAFLLVSDLNLTEELIEKINIYLKKKRNRLKVLLLDHHLIEDSLLEKTIWYNSEKENCATVFVNKIFSKLFDSNQNNKLQSYLENLSNFVNISDIWIKNHKNFQKALFFSDCIFSESKIFPDIEELNSLNREYKLFLIEKVFSLLNQNKSIYFIEKRLIDFKKQFISSKNNFKVENKKILKDKNISIRLKLTKFVYFILKNTNKEIYKSKDWLKFKVFFNLGEMAPYVANYYFEDLIKNEVPYIDFIILISPKGTMSFRSIGDINVKDIAFQYFSGWWHKNASWGFLDLGILNTKDAIINLIVNTLK